MNRWLYLLLPVIGWLTSCCLPVSCANGQSMSVSVSFRDNVAPILANKCLRCHGPDEAEGDFRIDQASSFEDYVEPGDAPMSELYAMITSTEEGYRMPPDSGDRLSENEIGTIEGWIIEGAKYQEVEDWEAKKFDGTDLAKTETISGAVWALLGRFHPALVHFPIALLTVAAFFAIFAFGNAHMEKAAIYCLVLGTLGSIVAATAGWGFAEYRGWPDYRTELVRSDMSSVDSPPEKLEDAPGLDDTPEGLEEPTAVAESQNDPTEGRRTLSEEEREKLGGKVVDPAEKMLDVKNFVFFDGSDKSMHRWGGVGVCLLAVVVTLLAMYVRRDPDNSQFVWKLATLILAGMVGWVGHQGGEIHYGDDLYDQPIERIKQLMNKDAVVAEPDDTKPAIPEGVVDPNITPAEDADDSAADDSDDEASEKSDDADSEDNADNDDDDNKASAEATLDPQEDGASSGDDEGEDSDD